METIKNKLPGTAAALLLLFCLFSCNYSNPLLEAKLKQRDEIAAKLSHYSEQLISLQTRIDRLTSHREQLYTQCQALNDSVTRITKESPLASAWIHEFDQQPIDILQEYLNHHSNDELEKLILGHLVLIAYGAIEGSQATIKNVRQQLQHLDQQKKATLNMIEELDQQIESTQQQGRLVSDLAANLQTQTNELNSEIKTYQN